MTSGSPRHGSDVFQDPGPAFHSGDESSIRDDQDDGNEKQLELRLKNKAGTN